MDKDGNEIKTDADDVSNWLRVDYDFKKRNRVGTWNQIPEGTSVQLARDDLVGSHKHAMRSFRRNLIQPSLIHKNGNPSGQSTGRRKRDYKDVLIYPEPDKSFGKYLKDLRAQGHSTKSKLIRNGKMSGYISDGYRSTIRSVINAVRDTHLSNRALLLEDGERLTEANFGLYGSDLRLLGVPTKERCFISSKAEDFNEVSKFITENVFVGRTADLPPDMRDLMELLEGYNRNTDYVVTDPLIEHHVATMSHTNRIKFVLNCFEKIEMIGAHGFSYDPYLLAVEKMSPKTNWKDRFSANPPPGVVIFDAVRKSFDKGDQQCHYKDRYPASETDIKMDVIRCIRNTTIHSREFLTKWFDDAVIDTMMMAAFGDIVLEFEKCLAAEHLLDFVITWKH